MNYSPLPDDGRAPEVRYDPTPNDSREGAMIPERYEKPPREGMTHAAKLASLTVLFSLVFVVGSLGFVVYTSQNSVSTQASSDTIPKGPAVVPQDQLALTNTITSQPIRYKGKLIADNLYAEGYAKYFSTTESLRKKYVINQIVLYYIYDDVLTINNISHQKARAPLTFDGIEETFPELTNIMKETYPNYDAFVTNNLTYFEF